MRIQPLHPFPARMAPELAIDTLRDLPGSSVVLDPMVGSGTVLRHASDMGHAAIGFDVDPLAVLISRVWTSLFAMTRLRKSINAFWVMHCLWIHTRHDSLGSMVMKKRAISSTIGLEKNSSET